MKQKEVIMHKEYECTILEIDTKFISKLENMGAKKIGEYFQKRYVYDFNPINENKWIRLRTNGIKTTLAIKEVIKIHKIKSIKLGLKILRVLYNIICKIK